MRGVIGFLSETEMKVFLRDCCANVTEDIANMIWNTVGGNIQHFMRYALSSEFDNKVSSIDDYKDASEEIIKHHYAAGIKSYFALTENAEQCTALSKVFRELGVSKTGALEYDQVAKDVGNEVLDSLIDMGAVYLLSGEYISTDRKKEEDQTLIIPNSPLDLTAIRRYMTKLPT